MILNVLSHVLVAFIICSESVPVTVSPPQPVLDSIKSAHKHSLLLKPAPNISHTNQKSPVTMPALKTRKSKVVTARHTSPPLKTPPPPPQAPPPPPLAPPPPPVSSMPQMQRSISQISNRRRMLEQVRVSGKKVASKLRQVETIEKRAFRVGELAQEAVQGQRSSVNCQLIKLTWLLLVIT